MPTVVRQSFTRTDTSVIYPWDPASPHYTECTDSYTAHNSYIESNYGVTFGPWVEESELGGYQEFTFPTDELWVEWIEQYYNDSSLYGNSSIPDVPGLTRSISVRKE